MTRRFFATGLAVVVSAALYFASFAGGQTSGGGSGAAGSGASGTNGSSGSSDNSSSGSAGTSDTGTSGTTGANASLESQPAGAPATTQPNAAPDAGSTEADPFGGDQTGQLPADQPATAADNPPSSADPIQGANDLTPSTPGSGGAARNDQSLLADPQSPAADPSGTGIRQPGQGAGQQPAQGLQDRNQQLNARQRQLQRDLFVGIDFGVAAGTGLAVTSLQPGTIFYDSGLRSGDVILVYDSQPIRSEADLTRWAYYRPGEQIPIVVLRDGRRETIYISYPVMDEPDRYQANRPVSDGPAFLGVGFDTQAYNAAVVRDVIAGSAAAEAGLREGDVIVALNGRDVGSFEEAIRLIQSMRAGDPLDIEFTRRVTDQTQAVLGSRSQAESRGVVPEDRSIAPSVEVRGYREGPMDDPAVGEEYRELP